ncbi:MAG: TldD/PmbA family protein [Candidatus Eisenbacteria bacterium]|jgi:TldD protein|nr:TldD/PmbA family protein [Candidatus Eisenbacteria bacterium]
MCDTERVQREAQEGLSWVMEQGAAYADVRVHLDDTAESLVMYDGNLEQNETLSQQGLGVRVLWGGAWGFCGTSDLRRVHDCFARSLGNARTAAALVAIPLEMGEMPGHRSTYQSPVQVDPFSLPLNERIDLLRGLDARLREDWIQRRIVMATTQKKTVQFWNSEGTCIEKRLTNVFGTVMIMAPDKDGQMQRRSHNLYTRGSGTRGWEMITDRELFGNHVDRVKQELADLLPADVLAHGRRSVILLPGQAWLQVHETIGHPLELDRILGYELSYAGGSLVTPGDIGTLRYGSERLNVSSFGNIENSPGSFGFDDDGTPERDYLLIDRGILVNVLSSRAMVNEVNHVAGRTVVKESGGAARATTFYRTPLERMTNVNILPGTDGTVEDIVAATVDGIIVDTPTSWSIGSNREHFHFGCEIAWEVKDGRRTRVLRNPTYQGHTIEFYNALDAVGDASSWRVEQVENCGKGEPNQIMQLGHGVPVVRFDNVLSGEKG